jgi:1-acyl-sn-glycerol-3-phosphate acyltransferase
MPGDSTFRPARPWGWVIRAVQVYLGLDLFRRNRVHIEREDLGVLRRLASGAGAILTSNHADEKDFEVCLDLSRRCGRRFLFMMNREAFDEGHGLAGWWLQRLGAFSVDRGGSNDEAKSHAVAAVKRGQEVLVVFSEGEIHNLNDLVQPFKSGAVEIGMRAVVEARVTSPGWTAFLIPMTLKYRYREPIGPVLEHRVRRMERTLSLRKSGLSLQRRLAQILTDVLHRQELAHHLMPDPDRLSELSERVRVVREAVLSQIEGRYEDPTVKPDARPMDRAWRLSSYLRGLLNRGERISASIREEIRKDLAALKGVGQMAGWQPEYVDLDPSQERLAETVLKLEREVYKTGRPRQLARRYVFVRVGKPIDLGPLLPDYLRDSRAACHRVTEQIRERIQGLIDTTGFAGMPTTVENAGRGIGKTLDE